MERSKRRSAAGIVGLVFGVAGCGGDPPPLPAFDAGNTDTGCVHTEAWHTIYNDPANCGSCGNTCEPGRACFGGRCDTRTIIEPYAPCPSADSYCPSGRCVGIGAGGPRVCSPRCDLQANCPPSTLGGAARPVCQTAFDDQCLLVCNTDVDCPEGLACRRPNTTSVAGVCAR